MIDHIKIRELISADYDGQATDEEKQIVEQHLKDCPQCRKYAEGFPKLSAALHAWPNEDLSPDLWSKRSRAASRGKDAYGYRAEFIDLVGKAKAIDTRVDSGTPGIIFKGE